VLLGTSAVGGDVDGGAITGSGADSASEETPTECGSGWRSKQEKVRNLQDKPFCELLSSVSTAGGSQTAPDTGISSNASNDN
jgi:hypothetical protein